MGQLSLSEMVLLEFAPKPSRRTPPGVRVVLGQWDSAWAGKQDRFLTWGITAEKVRAWTAEGALDRHAELTIETRPGDGIGLAFRAGTTAVLACDAVVIEPLDPRERTAAPRPWRHDFTVWGQDLTRTVGDLLPPGGSLVAADGAPADPAWPLADLDRRTHRTWILKSGDGRPLADVRAVFRHTPGWTLSVQRIDADDAEWDQVWSLPMQLGAARVMSRTLDTDAAGWSRWNFRRGS